MIDKDESVSIVPPGAPVMAHRGITGRLQIGIRDSRADRRRFGLKAYWPVLRSLRMRGGIPVPARGVYCCVCGCACGSGRSCVTAVFAAVPVVRPQLRSAVFAAVPVVRPQLRLLLCLRLCLWFLTQLCSLLRLRFRQQLRCSCAVVPAAGTFTAVIVLWLTQDQGVQNCNY